MFAEYFVIGLMALIPLCMIIGMIGSLLYHIHCWNPKTIDNLGYRTVSGDVIFVGDMTWFTILFFVALSMIGYVITFVYGVVV